MINSPVTGHEATLEKEINALELERGYRAMYDIDVSHILNGKKFSCINASLPGLGSTTLLI